MTLIFYDFETTGLNPYHDEIIEFAFKNDKRSISSLVKPSYPLKQVITDITGITNDMLQNDGISKEEAKQNIIEWLKTIEGPLYLIAHNNIGFDMLFFKKIMGEDINQFDIKYLDTLYLAKKLLPKMRSVSMKTLTKIFSIESGNHRALGDTCALEHVYKVLISKLPSNKRNVDVVYKSLLIGI
jgi:DNA polymerase III alpha subunit (gram-positive type)